MKRGRIYAVKIAGVLFGGRRGFSWSVDFFHGRSKKRFTRFCYKKQKNLKLPSFTIFGNKSLYMGLDPDSAKNLGSEVN
jgi:hypothetical protein